MKGRGRSDAYYKVVVSGQTRSSMEVADLPKSKYSIYNYIKKLIWDLNWNG